MGSWRAEPPERGPVGSRSRRVTARNAAALLCPLRRIRPAEAARVAGPDGPQRLAAKMGAHAPLRLATGFIDLSPPLDPTRSRRRLIDGLGQPIAQRVSRNRFLPSEFYEIIRGVKTDPPQHDRRVLIVLEGGQT